MDSTAHFEKTFTKVKWSNQSIPDREFEACTFTQCDLSTQRLLKRCKFAECTLHRLRPFHGEAGPEVRPCAT
jgi:hypothetical protein